MADFTIPAGDGMSCEACRFFDTRGGGAWNEGHCRRYAPRVRRRNEDHEKCPWPVVTPADWCGEFEKRPGRATGS